MTSLSHCDYCLKPIGVGDLVSHVTVDRREHMLCDACYERIFRLRRDSARAGAEAERAAREVGMARPES